MQQEQIQKTTPRRTDEVEPEIEPVVADRAIVDEAEAVLDDIDTVLDAEPVANADELLMDLAASEKIQTVSREAQAGNRAWSFGGRVD